MADIKNNGAGMKKADLLLAKVDKLSRQHAVVEEKLKGALTADDKMEMVGQLSAENAMLKKDLEFMSVQIESVYTGMAKLIEKLSAEVAALKQAKAEAVIDEEALAQKVAARLQIAPAEVDYERLAALVAERVRVPAVAPEIDYDALGMAVVEKMHVPAAVVEDVNVEEIAQKVADKVNVTPAEIDYDTLGTNIVQNMYIPKAVVEEVDYDKLADKLNERGIKVNAVPVAGAVIAGGRAEVDYEQLAALVAGRITSALPVQEVISADYIASKAAEQIVIPSVNTEELCERIERAVAAAAPAAPVAAVQVAPQAIEAEIDAQAVAEEIVAHVNALVSAEEIADAVAKQVGTVSPEQFEVLVDDDGCDSLARAVEGKLDYERLAGSIAEKISPAIIAAADNRVDAEELAKTLSEKLTVGANINEDVIADKAAAVLSNYLPEIDTDDIADKVSAAVIPVIPVIPPMDTEGLANAVADKLAELQAEQDFDIVIDEEGINAICEGVSKKLLDDGEEQVEQDGEECADEDENYDIVLDQENVDHIVGSVSEKVVSGTDARFDEVDRRLTEIKKLIVGGAAVVSVTEIAAAEAVACEEQCEEEECSEEDVPQAEEAEEEQIIEETEEGEEQLVTVSDLGLEDEQSAAEDDAVIEEIVEDIDETLAEGEVSPEDLEGMAEMSEGGVDFASMMKYNRSFIARIIQGSDEVKQYYGQVKNALLSYKKVNSNVAWGAERFNKGRETIARFKIRGKTLCLYLALDPNDYQVSVYHHLDVSDNKSMHGTPMMVKIKSPRGVKKAIRLIDEMLEKREGVKRNMPERDYAAMYPYESMEELIEDGLVKDVSKK